MGLCFLSLAWGCGDDPTSSAEPESLAVVSGNNQSGVVGDTLSAPITVLLNDRKGRPSIGRRIDFVVVQGDARTEPQTVVTDETGHARTVVILGDTSGAVTVEAKAFGVEAAAATFAASSVNLPAASIRIEDGDGQVGIISSPLPDPLVVVVLNERDEPVQGVPVLFEVLLGEAVVVASADTTDSQGIVRAQVVLGMDPGSIRLRATVSSINAVVNFVASATDTTNHGGEIVSSTSLVGNYVAAISISTIPMTLGASEPLTVAFTVEGLKGVRQYELRVQPEPANAFDISGAVFATAQPFVTPFASGIQIEGNVMRMGGASLGGGVDGAAVLGTLTIRTSSSFTDARLVLTQMSIGPSSSQRDAFSGFSPRLGVAVTSQ